MAQHGHMTYVCAYVYLYMLMDCKISCPICSEGDELNVNISENIFSITNVLV